MTSHHDLEAGAELGATFSAKPMSSRPAHPNPGPLHFIQMIRSGFENYLLCCKRRLSTYPYVEDVDSNGHPLLVDFLANEADSNFYFTSTEEEHFSTGYDFYQQPGRAHDSATAEPQEGVLSEFFEEDIDHTFI